MTTKGQQEGIWGGLLCTPMMVTGICTLVVVVVIGIYANVKTHGIIRPHPTPQQK